MLDSRKGVYPGSFDPIHNGHTHIAGQHTEHVDKLTIGIGYNPDKLSGDFHPIERARFIKDALLDLPEEAASKISVDFVKGLIVDYCQKKGIKYIFKSYRNDQDLKDETTQMYYNHILNPNVKTRLVQADPNNPLSNVSSSGEKAFVKLGANLTSPHTTLLVKSALETRLNQQYMVGMTGEIGSGKSYTGEQFVKIGNDLMIPTHNIDFDILGHNILKKSDDYEHVREEIKATFGDEVMNEDGSINRGALGKIVFSDPLEIKKLNQIMKESMQVEYRNIVAGKKGLIIINAALLAEQQTNLLTNNNLVNVGVDRDTQIRRILERENKIERITARGGHHLTQEDAINIMSRQFSHDEKGAYFAKQQQAKRFGKTVDFDNTNPTEQDTKNAFYETLDAVDTDLSLRFAGLCNRLKLTGDTNKLFQDVYFRYLQNNLPYHNRDHIKYGLKQIYPLRDKMYRPDLVEMAWFFHDIVYNTSAGKESNELQSAKLAKELLIKHGLSPNDAAYVYRLIMATEYKGNFAYTKDEQYIMDIDTSILGADPVTYTNYTKSIRMEYLQYTDQDYNLGRATIMSNFIKKPTFQTPEFAHLNDTAKANVEHEIEELKK